MRFPDRPVLNGLLGVVCALIVLGLLSWPGLVGQNQASPLFAQNKPTESNTAGAPTSSSSAALAATTSAVLSSSSLASSSSEASQPLSGSKSQLIAFSISF